MSDDEVREPPVHFKQVGDKWALCFSAFGKIAVTVVSTVTGSILVGAFVFAWQSNGTLSGIATKIETIAERLDRMDHRIDRIDDKLDRKADR